MIEDLAQLPDGLQRDCDVCVVGTGAAGLAVATELQDSGRTVVVLESGAEPFEESTQQLYDCSVTGLQHVGHARGRFRTYGGSTTRWGGQSLPLTESDFEVRDWVAESGWPIRRRDLVSHYARASEFLLTDDMNFDTDVFRRLGFTPPALDPTLSYYHFSKWCPRPSLRQVYGPKMGRARDVTLIHHANLTRIDLDPSHLRVASVEARSLSGTRLIVRPKQLVLCLGGIETARVLLANDHQQPGGIGNARGLVGSHFQDHPTAIVGTIDSPRPDELQRLFHSFYRRRRKYAPRIGLSFEAQKHHKILNASSVIQFDSSPESAYWMVKTAVGELLRGRGNLDRVKQLTRGAMHANELARPVFEYLVRGRGFTPRPRISVTIFTEQEPNRESRIALANETDSLGMRKSRVHWQLTDLTLRTIGVFADILKRELERLGLGRLILEEWLISGAGGWQEHIADLFHHMGTTRMSSSPENGVVDPQCRVHELENLWIASSAVFPTGGHSNPTLTILALAMRLADELKRRF